MSTLRKLIPKPFLLFYHWCLAWLAAIVYGLPSRSIKVIGVTGTKGKSTTCYMIAKIFEDQGKSVAMIGSLGYRIKQEEWPNTLKMTMPGRFHLQRFLRRAVRAGCEYVIVEVTSEGIAQHRLNGVHVDCAVFTNLHQEHIESHGGFENYKEAKKKLFRLCKNIHVMNCENQHSDEFLALPAKTKLTFGREEGDLTQKILGLQLKLAGDFNIFNALAAIGVAHVYGLDFLRAKASVESVTRIPGRMEFVEMGQPFEVVVDYAHTPESLEGVYQTLKPKDGKLICVLGAAGGGRDTWKRPVFGEIADAYCAEIILTNEDPYEEDPDKILDEITIGIKSGESKVKKIMDRGKAIYEAIHDARQGDTVVITGKGSETSMALAGGKRISWSDVNVAQEVLRMRK